MDDGSPDPRVTAALDAYAAGRGGEHAVLAALDASRLLVPVVAVLAEEDTAAPGGPRRDKSSEMALPTVIGTDGRAAVPAFTSAATLARWRAEARPVPVPAARVWQSGATDASTACSPPRPAAYASRAAVTRGSGDPSSTTPRYPGQRGCQRNPYPPDLRGRLAFVARPATRFRFVVYVGLHRRSIHPAPEDRVIRAELPTRSIEPGTPMVKVIPPRLVEPYLTGQRLVIAGYVYRAGDCSFSTPSEYYKSLALGFEGSEFSADMPELFVLRWIALEMSASLVPGPRPASGGPVSAVPEFFTLPVPIPVGAEMSRVTFGAEEFIGRHDGQVWLRPLREA